MAAWRPLLAAAAAAWVVVRAEDAHCHWRSYAARYDDVRAAWRTPKDVLNGKDWGILEDGQESFDPEADGVLVAKLPWRVAPSTRGISGA